jgi:putative ABC transport system permease protein
MLWETLKLAIQAILRNALRSALTVLGIIIGVGAVIAMVTIGRGTTAQVTADIAKLGTNLLNVRSGQMRMGGGQGAARPFQAADVDAVRQQVAGAAVVSASSTRGMAAIVGANSWNTIVTGADNGFFDARNWTLAAGRFFLDSEVKAGKTVCVIGETVRDKLFPVSDPIGQLVRLKKVSCEIVGLLAPKGQTSIGADEDDLVVMPLRSFQRRITGSTNIGTILVSARDDVTTSEVQSEIESLMRERRRISPREADDFTVFDMKQITATMTGTTQILTGLLGAVAAVSLLVGGIGIMNIMLVSVTERTREIGIRLAIGALEEQVLLQFLVEAIVLSLFGGVLGVALGLGLAAFVTQILGVPFLLDPAVIAVAFAFSGLVGVVFGYFPARRAARLDPVEALRHE